MSYPRLGARLSPVSPVLPGVNGLGSDNSGESSLGQVMDNEARNAWIPWLERVLWQEVRHGKQRSVRPASPVAEHS